MMHKRSYYLVNTITSYRLIAAPVLILLIIYNKNELFKWLLAISFLTDAFDGYLARRFGVTSIFGSRLDSLADDFTIIAAIIGLFALKKEFVLQEIVILSVLFGLFVVQTVSALIRYGKISSFHTYAAKAAAILQAVFLVMLFFSPDPPFLLFYFTAIVSFIDLLEEIILVFMLPEWQTNVKGLYWII
jgi:CDP-diacylglycerol--glycerol-3-phosphate 3-phosphatidyltransferase